MLCDALFASFFRYDGEKLHSVATSNPELDFQKAIRDIYPLAPDRTQISGRVILARSVVGRPPGLSGMGSTHIYHARAAPTAGKHRLP